MSAAFSLKVNRLRKEYGERVVLDIDDLRLESDCSYALVGPNGSGKSTFLKVLAGVIDQTSGYVDVEGSLDRTSLRVGYMPQKSYIFGFSVLKNVSLAIASSGLPRGEMEKRARESLEAVGMAGFEREKGSGLSGGEAQRVALARLLVQDLDVMLLDEPTASMDIAGTLLVEKALETYCQRTGCMVVVATHAPSQARRISEQAVMLSAGRVVEFGATDSVLTNPTTAEGRDFLSYWTV